MDTFDPRLRLAELARDSIARAFVLSLLIHISLIGIVELGARVGLWQNSLLRLLKNRDTSSQLNQTQSTPQAEIPLIFVEVDPTQATPETPKDAKYYSSVNSRAANQDATLDTSTPQISGTQDKVPRTMDVPRSRPEPLQPTVAPEPVTQEQVQAKPSEPAQTTSGDLALARPTEKTTLTPSLSPAPTAVAPEAKPRRRPMRIAEALQQKGLVAGEKMKQEGGVKRYSIAEGLDVKAMPFGDYDAAIIASIQQRWYDLLDERDYARDYIGKVVLTFRLNSDGRVTEMRVVENEVSEILAMICQRAVRDPAPYRPWPSDMRRVIGADYRDVRFTFHHN